MLVFQEFLKGMNTEYQEVMFTGTMFSLIVGVNFENLFHFFKSNYQLTVWILQRRKGQVKTVK